MGEHTSYFPEANGYEKSQGWAFVLSQLLPLQKKTPLRFFFSLLHHLRARIIFNVAWMA